MQAGVDAPLSSVGLLQHGEDGDVVARFLWVGRFGLRFQHICKRVLFVYIIDNKALSVVVYQLFHTVLCDKVLEFLTYVSITIYFLKNN